MPHLTLNLLGPFQALLDDAPVPFRSDKERALLAFLAVEADRPHRREALTGLLYPDQEQAHAQSNLRKTLFRLRAALGETDDAGILLVTPKTVQFNPAAPHTLDAQKFRAEMERVRTHKHRRVETCAVCAANLATACEIYRGEFLAGFNRSGSDAFEEWAVITREQLHQHALDALEQLIAFHLQRSDWERAAAFARRMFELESWRESAHRALMTAFAAQGQRAAAFAQYDACKKILREQFDAEPEHETRALYETIRNGTFTPPQPQVSNLQSPLTPLIGRTREIETLTARLLDPAQRLHTIVGPGGIGKTRLALAAAERVRHDFRHGAFFVALADIHSDTPNVNDAIATAAADTLNVTFSGSIAPTRQLQNYLRDKEVLLVLDNLEQLMTSAVWLVELLVAAPQLTLLITSREPLNVRAENILRLDGLSVPDTESEIDLRASDGVQLFVERAARAAGHFTVTSETLRIVAKICRRLEGMPLALELAAAWSRTRTLSEILSALDASLDFLATRQRDIPARHASLRAVWASSWELLTPREQALLAQLAVFRGGFNYQAAGEIINVQQVELDIFIDKSLLKRKENGRYELHELIHQFILEKPQISINTVLYNYCIYYLNFVSQNGAKLQKSEPQTILNQIRPELANIRAAWHNSIEHAWFELVTLEVVQGITTFYYLTGLFREGFSLVEQALARINPNHAGRAELELAHAKFLERLARYDEATATLSQLLANPTLDAPLRARTQLRVGWVCYWTGKLEEGRAALQETLQWANAHAQSALEADALYVAGLIEQSAADIPRARDLYERALALYRANHNRYGESSALVNLADIAVDHTALDDALRHGQAALKLATHIGKRFDQAAANVILGSLYYELGNYPRATPYYFEALQLFREMGNSTGEIIALRDLARLALAHGALAEALGYAEEAARAAQQSGSAYREGMTQCVMGDIYLAQGETARAEQCYQDAIALLRRAERGHRALDARAGLVRAAHQRGDAAAARALGEKLLTALQRQTFYDSDNPSALYLLCVQILAPEDAVRAREILQRGRAELAARAANIRDDALRHEFLNNNPFARALQQL